MQPDHSKQTGNNRSNLPQKRTLRRPSGYSVLKPIPAAKFRSVAGVLIGIGFAARLIHLGARQLWLDEAFSHYLATLSNWFASLVIDNNPPLYYLILRGWVQIAGTTEFSLRFLSALSGALFVGAVIWAGSEIFNRRVGLWSGFVAAFSPIHIYYSQEARGYALLDLFLILSLIFIWRAHAANRMRDWLFFGIAMSVALYLHYLAPLALLPMLLILFYNADHMRRMHCLATAASGFLVFCPWLIWSFVLANRSNVGTSWIQDIWDRTPKLLAVPLSLEIFGLGSEAGLVPMWMHQYADLIFPSVFRLTGILLLIGLAVLVALSKGDKAFGIANVGMRKAWLAVLLLAPLLMLWLVSWIKPIYAIGRYDFLAYPAFPLLVGFALGKVHHSKGWVAAVLIAALLMIPIGAKLYFYYNVPDLVKPRVTAQFLDSEVRDGDVVVFTGLRALPVLYYLSRIHYVWSDGFCTKRRGGRKFYCRMYPRAAEATPAADVMSLFQDSSEMAGAELADYQSRLEPGQGRLWVVFSGTLPVPAAEILLYQQLMKSGFTQLTDQEANDLFIIKLRI